MVNTDDKYMVNNASKIDNFKRFAFHTLVYSNAALHSPEGSSAAWYPTPPSAGLDCSLVLVEAVQRRFTNCLLVFFLEG